jgi:hypothetical protein
MHVIFEDLIVVAMKVTVFRVVLLISCLSYSLLLKMAVVHSSEMSENFYQKVLYTAILHSTYMNEMHGNVDLDLSHGNP